MRTHISIPDDLVREVDAIAGKRKRSEFIVEAVREKLRLERQRLALKAGAGILRDSLNPEWSTPEKTTEWVHRQRLLDDEITWEKLGERID